MEIIRIIPWLKLISIQEYVLNSYPWIAGLGLLDLKVIASFILRFDIKGTILKKKNCLSNNQGIYMRLGLHPFLYYWMKKHSI